jgi:predicted short-subunit dehydrogenase-like oxidoreductase (DUF2520 family)
MPEHPKERIAIVGLGRLGSQLAVWLSAVGLPPAYLVSSRPAHAASVAARIPAAPKLFATVTELANAITASPSAAPTLVFLTIPDGALGKVATELAALKPLASPRTAFIHSSGAHPAAVLSALTATGCQLGCFHPLQSFGPLDNKDDPHAGNPFRGITVGIEAAPELAARLNAVAKTLSANTIALPADPRLRANYHAAAVTASNALCGLTDMSIELMTRAGVSPVDAQRALLPLVMGTLFNLLRLPPGQALTGPVARGDAGTIGTHLAAMADDPALAALYSNITARVLLLALNSGRINEAQARAISDELLKRLAAVNDGHAAE